MPTLTASERIGTTLGGRYEIRRLIGEGGFSAVFEAVHSITGREVALKLLHPHLTTTEQITERFLMEARSMARIKHDGIVQVLDAGTDPDGSVFIALELLDGESLESTLLRVHRLTWGESVSICVDVLGALAEAHRHKIIHRDIKPGNIFIVRKPDGSSQAKLLDFGIAHVAQAKNKLTAAGMILGTPEYMSPEQGRTANVGPESDLWSVGIVMWECLTGHTPFVAETATEILLKIATSDAPPIVDEVPDLPPSIAAVIDKSLVRDVTARHRTADEMREAMQRAVRKADEVVTPPPRSVMRGNTPAHTGTRLEVNEPRRGPEATSRPALGAPPTRTNPPARTHSGDSIPVVRPANVVEVASRGATGSQGDRSSPQRSSPSATMSRPGSSSSTPTVSSRGAAAVAEARAQASPPPRATGVMPAGSADESSESRVRHASGETRRHDPGERATPTAPSRPSDEPPAVPTVSSAGVSVHPGAASSVRELVPLEFTERESRSLSNKLHAPGRPSTPPPQVEGDVRVASPRLSPTPTPAQDASPEPPPLTFEERESRLFSGQNATFQKPPQRSVQPTLVLGGLAALGLIAVGLWLSVGDSSNPAPDGGAPTRRPDPVHALHHGDAARVEPADNSAAFTFEVLNDIAMPQGVTGADNAAEFARHAAASYHAGTTQRMVATCIPGGEEGSTLFLNPMTPGALRPSARGLVACAGYDLGVLPDLTADGSDDVVAVAKRPNTLYLLDSRTLRPYRTIEVEGVRGVASGAHVTLRGEPLVVVYAEPGGSSQPTEVRAIGALSSRVVWRIHGSGRMGRVGNPVELGLAVGPDANGDETGDVAVGLGPVLGTEGSTPDDRRCVQFFSGADGHALWAQPFCQAFTRGSQSVSVGPDVNGDGKADVVVGNDHPGDREAPVVLLSGADGTVVRQWTAPAGEVGFGWPVALSGDLNDNRTPEVIVGTVGARTALRVFDATTGQAVGSVDLGGVGSGNLRVFPVPPLVQGTVWSLVVANPGGGLRVYARHNTEEPL